MPVFRKQYTQRIPDDAEPVTLKDRRGKAIPGVRFRGKDGKAILAPLTRDGKRCRMTSPTWYGRVDGAHVPLCTNKTAAEQMLAKLVTDAKLQAHGLIGPYEEHRKYPLADHLQDFRDYLTAKGNTAKHAQKTEKRVQAILDGCGFKVLSHLSPTAMMEWLADQRAAGRIGIKTSNYYLRDIKSFCRWLVKDRRIGDNPLAYLSGMNAKVEAGLERRTLPDDDLEVARSAWLDEAGADVAERERREASTRLCYRDAAGRVFDFHALRHQFISSLAAAGVHPKVAQTMARHSTITLTMDRYTHVGLLDTAAALDKLPALPSDGADTERDRLAATGTYGRDTYQRSPGKGQTGLAQAQLPCSFLAHPADSERESTITIDNAKGRQKAVQAATEPLESIRVAPTGESMITPDNASRPRGGMADTGDLKSPGR